MEVPAIQEDQPILEDQAIAEGLQVEVPTIVVDHPEEAHPVEILDQAVAERFTLPSVHRAGPLGPLETVLIEIPQADSSDC